jgi:ABC-2 type transport system ATP-binding protein
VLRLWTAAATVVAAALLVAAAAPSSTFGQQDVTITSADGTRLAATIFTPDGSPPAGGWPAVVFMHGLGGDRSSATAIARGMGMIGDEYVVLAFDARGHGKSEGLVGIDGPNEIGDVKAVFSWLRERPDVADGKIGAWGISYGGGAALGSLTAGVPWAAVEPVITWTDLRQALMPQGLAKTGVVAGFLTSLDPTRVEPEVFAVRDAAFTGNVSTVTAFGSARSSALGLRGETTPIFMMQGRRDFAFGLDQARTLWSAVKGPKRLWIGNMGHPPSGYLAPDTAAMLREGKLWFDRWLRGVRNGIDGRSRVVLAASSSARLARFTRLPKTTPGEAIVWAQRPIRLDARVPRSRAVLRSTPLPAPVEVFGAPAVRVVVTAAKGWSRLVAVLSARTPAGREIVVAAGGVPLRDGRSTVTIRMIDQATFLPRGSRLTLTLAGSSLAQDPANLLYLDLPMPDGASAVIHSAALTVPRLAQPVSR